MKKMHVAGLIAVLLALLVGVSMAYAQDEELTLEGLAETGAGLVGRIEAIEGLFDGPGAIELEDNRCVLGVGEHLQDATVIKYKDTYDEWLIVEFLNIVAVQHSSESGNVSILYEDWDERFVIEEWSGCEFVGSSDWWEEE